jgi:hypothetical protein
MTAVPPVMRPVVAPVVAPVGAPVGTAGGRRARAFRFVALAAAVVLVVPTVVGAARTILRATAPPMKAGSLPSLFPANARSRIEALRDRLARGLLSLREPEGDFSTKADGVTIHPAERAEATWLGVAGLAAARRMGSRVSGIGGALDVAKAIALKRTTKSGMPSGTFQAKRGVAVSSVACAVLALSLSGEPADEKNRDFAGQTLVNTSVLGTLAQGWVQGVVARAMAQLSADDRTGLLVPTPVSAIPTKPIKLTHGFSDAHVAEALAEEIQRGLGASPSDLPAQVFEKMLEDPPAWVGEQTDIASWLLQAWLAARRPDGARWFALVLAQLDKGVGGDGVVSGDYYGYPVSRTAGALLLLWEGDGPRREGAP